MSERPDDWDDVAEGGSWGSEITSEDFERMFSGGLWIRGERLIAKASPPAATVAAFEHVFPVSHDRVVRCSRCGLEALSALDRVGYDYVAWHNHKARLREWEPVPPQCPVPDHLRPYVANPYYHRRAARARREAEALGLSAPSVADSEASE